jgi:phosphopantetheinyl transferase
MMLQVRYLSRYEKREFTAIKENKARIAYLIRKIVVKDAVRAFLKGEGGMSYPIEIFIGHEEGGKPFVHGMSGLDDDLRRGEGGELCTYDSGGFDEMLKDVEISLAHKGMHAVAIASDKPVGIDLEVIEARDDSFKALAFTQKELEALSEVMPEERPEWETRFWVAKEAYSKMLGTGLGGNPRQFEVEAISEDIFDVCGCMVQTMRLEDNYIVGWTI